MVIIDYMAINSLLDGLTLLPVCIVLRGTMLLFLVPVGIAIPGELFEIIMHCHKTSDS